MNCPKCEQQLKQVKIAGVKVDHCENCGGLWFDKDELKLTRDSRDKDLSWLEVDLWNDKNKIAVSDQSGNCPKCNKSLFKVKYGDSDIMVDVCLDCRGVWLDKKELDKIISYLEEKVDKETIPEYLKDLEHEVAELIVHPSKIAIEARHILILMKLIDYRFMSQHPRLAEIVSGLPK